MSAHASSDLIFFQINPTQKSSSPSLVLAPVNKPAKSVVNRIPKVNRVMAQRQNQIPKPITVPDELTKPDPQYAISSSTISPAREQSDVNEAAKPSKGVDYNSITKTVKSISHEMETRTAPAANRNMTRIEKFEKEVEKAKRGDCRTEHASLGILGIPLLIKDAISDKGCKW